MGIKEIENEIRRNGEKEAERIRLEAERQISDLKKEVEKEALSKARELEERNARDLALERKRIIASANMQIKEGLERRKDELIEGVFEEARKKVLSMNDTEKSRLLKKLSDEAKRGLESPTVWVDRKYSKLLRGAKARDLGDFGVVVTSGHVSVDNTLGARLEKIKSESRHKVAEVLWQG